MTDDYTHAAPEAMEEAIELVSGYAVHYGKKEGGKGMNQSLAAVSR